MVHLSGSLVAHSVSRSMIFCLYVDRSASSTDARPSMLLSSDDVDFSPRLQID